MIYLNVLHPCEFPSALSYWSWKPKPPAAVLTHEWSTGNVLKATFSGSIVPVTATACVSNDFLHFRLYRPPVWHAPEHKVICTHSIRNDLWCARVWQLQTSYAMSLAPIETRHTTAAGLFSAEVWMTEARISNGISTVLILKPFTQLSVQNCGSNIVTGTECFRKYGWMYSAHTRRKSLLGIRSTRMRKITLRVTSCY
jgi:hypothetical protein